jgi:hypothetical protein
MPPITEVLDSLQGHLASGHCSPLDELRREFAELKQTVEELTERIPLSNSGSRIASFPFSPARPLTGIIRHLIERAGSVDRLAETKSMFIDASSYDSEPYKPVRLIDQEDTTYFHTGADPQSGEWICLDFNERRVMPSYDTILSRHNYDVDGWHLKSWVLEGSETSENARWFPLDIQLDNRELNHSRARGSWPIAVPAKCQLVRLRALGSHGGGNHLILARFELFGQLYSPE